MNFLASLLLLLLSCDTKHKSKEKEAEQIAEWQSDSEICSS